MNVNFKILAIFSAIIISFASYAADGDKFYNGALEYRIISEEKAEVEIYGYYPHANVKKITVSSTVHNLQTSKEYTITAVGAGAFSGGIGSEITSVELPNTITSIGEGAFFACHSLVSVKLPENLTVINYETFYWCSSLSSINLPNSLVEIGDGAFCGCHELTKISLLNDGLSTIGMGAFNGCGFTKVYIPISVSSIGVGAFSNCKKLEEISVSNRNERYMSIDGVLFTKDASTLIQYPGNKIGNYNIPNSVSLIESYAFSSCDGLTSVNIPNSVSSINTGTFEWCENLKSVDIPNSVTSIGDMAFEGCSQLISVDIPNSVTSIGDMAFEGCCQLTSVDIPNSVTSIGYKAFWNCPLTSIIIPNSVTSIGSGAFDGDSLKEIIISDGTDQLNLDSFCFSDRIEYLYLGRDCEGEYYFQNCKYLAKVIIGSSVSSINYSISFQGCSALKELIISDGTTTLDIDAYNFLDNTNNIEYLYLGRDYSCWIEPFILKRSLSKLIISNSVNTIHFNAFSACDSLKEVIFEDGSNKLIFEGSAFSRTPVEYVYMGRTFGRAQGVSSKEQPFYKHPTLKKLTLSNYASIESNAFYGCDNLIIIDAAPASTAFHNENSYMRSSAFQDCINLESVVLPHSVTTIDSDAFNGCKNLKSVKLNELLNNIGSKAFNNCSSLTSIRIPASVTSIGAAAFCAENLSSIEVDPLNETFCSIDGILYTKDKTTLLEFPPGIDLCFTVPEYVNSIGDYAFWRCKLSSVEFPASILEIGNKAFCSCDGLQSIEIPESVTIIKDFAFADCTGLTKVTIGNSVESIGSYAFSGSSGLTEISIPNSVESIGNYAFSGSNLTLLKLPNSLKDLKEAAFAGCYNLSSIYYNSQNPIDLHLSNAVFAGSYYTATLFVPKSAVEKCRTSAPWKYFKNIAGFEFQDITHEDSISLNPSEWICIEGSQHQITATVFSANAIDRKLEWFSNDEKIATVSASGLVQAIKPGVSIITVTTSDGLTASCEVTVLPDPAGIDDVGCDVAQVEVDGNNIVAPHGSEVYDMSGRRVKPTGLRPGIYIVKIPQGKTAKVMVK